jgi:hypothetical protein
MPVFGVFNMNVSTILDQEPVPPELFAQYKTWARASACRYVQ